MKRTCLAALIQCEQPQQENQIQGEHEQVRAASRKKGRLGMLLTRHDCWNEHEDVLDICLTSYLYVRAGSLTELARRTSADSEG